LSGFLWCFALASAFGQTQAPAKPVRVRGIVQNVSTSTLTVLDKGAEVIELQLPATTPVTEVFQISIADIQAGSFIGTAAMPQADGTQRAIAVTVFPESARGVGEGHRPFDLLPQSTMTNATVAEVLADAAGRTLHVKSKDGEKTVAVPKDVPVVTYKPGDRSLLVLGASVSISAQIVDEKPTAVRINAARDGFKLPY
ncbi:MAG: hypothetical protein WCK93_13565, partial [Nitrosomonadales bacterium]